MYMIAEHVLASTHLRKIEPSLDSPDTPGRGASAPKTGEEPQCNEGLGRELVELAELSNYSVYLGPN